MTKKILFSIYQTENHSNGGVNSMTQILEQDNAVTPYILTNRKGPFNKRWEAKGWDITVSNIKWGSVVSSQGKFSKITDLIKTNFLAYKLLKKHKLKILYCNDVQGFWCAYFGGKLAGAKIIFNLRDTKSAAELSSLKKWQFIAEKSDTVVVLSNEMKDFVVQKLLLNKQAEKVIVTYSIVNQEVFHPVTPAAKKKERDTLKIAPDLFVVSYVAAFNAKKAQLPFIENVISRFKHRNDIKFYFIGDFDTAQNPYAKACLDVATSLDINHLITFVGHVSNVDKWYKASDLVAIASNKEGLARCMIEAISCGTPVISFNVCSAKEILADMNTGEVIEMGDYENYGGKISSMIDNKQLMHEYSANGVEAAAQLFKKETVLNKYHQYIRNDF